MHIFKPKLKLVQNINYHYNISEYTKLVLKKIILKVITPTVKFLEEIFTNHTIEDKNVQIWS